MAGKEITEKMLLDYADVFADVINVGLLQAAHEFLQVTKACKSLMGCFC